MKSLDEVFALLTSAAIKLTAIYHSRALSCFANIICLHENMKSLDEVFVLSTFVTTKLPKLS